jgi:tripartite-type tricarboxylate transporter receptor subunit TctC
MKQFRFAFGALFAVLICAAPAFAQGYPTRPIRLIVPFGTGGGTDILARIIEPLVTKELGQPLVIENRAGGGSIIGMDVVAKAGPDGYTLVMTDTSIAVNPSLKPLPYDTIKDFAPVSLLATAPVILVGHPSLQAKTLQEFVALAKQKPGALNYASGGVGSSTHLGGELLKFVAGIDVRHVPYKGTGPAMQALMGGEIDWVFEALGSAAGQIRAGTVRPIVVTSAKRSPAFPEIPTAIESGLAGFEITSWYGLWVPAGTPPAVVQKLHDAVVKAFADPELRDTWAKLGAEPGGSSAEAFKALIDQDVAKWGKVVREAKITLD